MIGEYIRTWFDTGVYDKKGDPIGKILEVLPYVGKYPNFFDCIIKIEHQGMNKGYVERAYNSKDFPAMTV